MGCGAGSNMASLADDYDCIGIDSSSTPVNWPASRFPKPASFHGQDRPTLAGSIHRAPIVILSNVLERIADDFRLFSELLAAVRARHVLLLTVPAEQAL